MRGATIIAAALGVGLMSGAGAQAGEGVLARMRGAFDAALSQAGEAAAQKRNVARAVRDLMGESVRLAAQDLADPAYFAQTAPLALPPGLAAQQARLAMFGASEPLDALQEDARLAAAAAAAAIAETLRAEVETVELGDTAGLLAAGSGAAVTHLWVRSQDSLTEAAQAAVRDSLTRSQALAGLDRLGESRLVESAKADFEQALVDHFADHALEALRAEAERAEAAIRADPALRSTPALAAALGPPA